MVGGIVKPCFASRSILFHFALRMICAVLGYSVGDETNERSFRRRLRQQSSQRNMTDTSSLAQSRKILYIVTSLHEYDDGRRETHQGYDRFANTLIPVLRESTRSIVKAGFQVDLYLVTHYPVSRERMLQVQAALPPTVGFSVWDEATPLSYISKDVDDTSNNSSKYLQLNKRALARQHRYIIKDKIFDYDFFVNFEDDMIVKADHVQQYLQLTQSWYSLRQTALMTTIETRNNENRSSLSVAQGLFYGPMNKLQLERLVPGFIRLEAALDNYHPHLRNMHRQIPLDPAWNSSLPESRIDPSICCHVSRESVNDHIPEAPSANQLFLWETAMEALGVRQLPTGDWALLLGGNSDRFYSNPNLVIGDYWSGRDGYFKATIAERPDKTKSLYVSNQGGWMATRRQILDWHRRWCRGGFLPPFQSPHHMGDGLEAKTVEYWSGGIQIAGVLGCNLQRVIMLEPDQFAKHLIYHSSNNKQKVKNVQYRFSSRNIQEFWEQLNSIRKNAQQAMEREKLNSDGKI